VKKFFYGLNILQTRWWSISSMLLEFSVESRAHEN